MKENKTDELLKTLEQIENRKELENLINEYHVGKGQVDAVKYLCELILKKGLRKSDVIRDSGISRTYAYQIFQGIRQPGRDKLILLGIGAHLSLAEMQKLLTSAGMGVLFPKKKRDFVLMFALKKQLNVVETNALLYDLKEMVLD